jgi:hypothetical protein
MDASLSDSMFAELTAFTQFEGVVEPRHYRPLPDDWALATSDIVGSTKAIEAGRYKAVNMAGASVISAILNALGRRDIPFVFGGDGAVVAVPGPAIETARNALADVQAWVADELKLTLRAAIVPVGDIRASGLDVRVARYQVSPEVSYAMFAGGGASWAEAQMRAGRFVVAPAPPGSRPDLTGLSCRWQPIAARHGEILSVIVVPGAGGTDDAFRQLVSDIVSLAGGEERAGNPVAVTGPSFALSPVGFEYEARASAPKGKRLQRILAIAAQNLLAIALDTLGRRAGRFDPKLYRSDVALNSDFRKFDDGLKMTVDLDSGRSRRITERLEMASKMGICRYGLHSQDTAIMTCIVPSPLTRDHMHFVDGSSGGYAIAASHLKAQAAKQ